LALTYRRAINGDTPLKIVHPNKDIFMTDTQREETVAIVFADISGSTPLYERVGNTKAHEQISACLALLKSIVAEHDGEFVHSRGDDVVCTFKDCQNAFKTTRDMLAKTEGGELLVHIGLDFGDVIRVRDDIFGDCVNAAARFSSLANANEAICSELLRSKVNTSSQAELTFFDTRHLKGKRDAANVYRYAVPNLDMGTQIFFGKSDGLSAAATTPAPTSQAKITFDGETVVCSSGREITIGRSETCDLVLPFGWVSRQHAVLEMRKDHAYLRDVSSNGVYVCVAGQPPVLLRRETMLLPPKCSLSPTNHPDAEGAISIDCEVTL